MSSTTMAPTTMPQYLVETDWLENHLEDPDLRILDCTVFLKESKIESGQVAWAEGHIPGSSFVDIINDLSDTTSRYPFMMPSATQFSEAISAHGVGNGTKVVLYDGAMNIWAARVWWMLRAFGFDNAAVLNGGWKKWQQEGRPISTEPATHAPAQFTANPRAGLIADQEDILAALKSQAIQLVNALPSAQFEAKRIPGSLNLSFAKLVDRESNAYLPVDRLRQTFEQSGILADGQAVGEQIITYCGGGIAASSEALLLTMLGIDNVAVYDGSMSEWGSNPKLPTEGTK